MESRIDLECLLDDGAVVEVAPIARGVDGSRVRCGEVGRDLLVIIRLELKVGAIGILCLGQGELDGDFLRVVVDG